MANPAKLHAIRTLIAAAPDQALASLAMALGGAGGDLQPVADAITQEQTVRRLSAVVFAPLMPLLTARADGVASTRLSRPLLKEIWRILMDRHPDAMAILKREVEDWDPHDPPPLSIDEMCREAARLADEEATTTFKGVDEGAAARELAAYLALAPYARKALGRLGEWLGRANEERAAVLRLIFKDAAALKHDSAPRMMEMILGHLPEAALVLRPISLITERACDRYLSSSELASFGERLLDQVDARIERLRAFDVHGGAAAARAAAADAGAAGAMLDEIEHSIDLSRDGPWGARVGAARNTIASLIEARLRDAPRAVEQALPMQPVRLTGRMTRPSPRIAFAPEARFVEPATALMVLLGETRHAAATGGFGALRTQVAEMLSDWLEVYADELVHLINAGEAPEPLVAQQYLELAADFLTMAENEKAARIVRRRAAVAGAGTADPSHDAA